MTPWLRVALVLSIVVVFTVADAVVNRRALDALVAGVLIWLVIRDLDDIKTRVRRIERIVSGGDH